MLIMMAGLPASGKSAIARQLAPLLPAIILDKDKMRAALFPPSEIEYSTAQNDFCMDIALQVAGYILRRDPRKYVILDGRPFSKRYQRLEVARLAERLPTPLKVIECVCADETARQRLEQAVSAGEHVAANRDYNLYLTIKAHFEPIEEPKLVVDTDHDLDMCVRRCLDYIKSWESITLSNLKETL
jgi:predicted kinase